ncbi:MAG: hypothetical protein KGL39_27180 [Patescibacteria group bacterium]|nr:hypothetical protein [Patescibacteria group bacterium]
MNDVPLINHLPEKWRGWVLIVIAISPYLTRAYHAISSGGGIRGILSAIWLGTNMPTPKQTTENQNQIHE